MWTTIQEIEAFIREFEAGDLPKPRWTHNAHLVVALWYLSHHSFEKALDLTRQNIRAHNKAVGTRNTDNSGYHETITRLYLLGVQAQRADRADVSLPEILAGLLASPLGHKDWPLQLYSRERLFSVDARHRWVEPDLCSEKFSTLAIPLLSVSSPTT